jgi:hypothetical protein
MQFTNVQYNTNKITNENCSISCVINGLHVSVPLDPANTDYAEIMRQVEAGELTIAEAN